MVDLEAEEEKPTRTLPVSVWAEIMTPAQSLTEVIHPTSLAGASSFSSGPLVVLSAVGLLAGLFTFWASWKKEQNEVNKMKCDQNVLKILQG